MSILEPVQAGFTAVVNAISGVAQSQGGNVAGTLNSVTGTSLIDPSIGATLIIMVAGIMAWKLIKSAPIRYAILIIIGAIIFRLWLV